MTVLERLRQAIELLPDEAAVSLPVTLLRAALAEVPGPATASAAPELLTVARLAALLHRSPSTVRGWLARGDFGSAAVRVHGRSWIVPRDAVTDFLKRQHRGDRSPEASLAEGAHGRDGLGAWRRVRPGIP